MILHIPTDVSILAQMAASPSWHEQSLGAGVARGACREVPVEGLAPAGQDLVQEVLMVFQAILQVL